MHVAFFVKNPAIAHAIAKKFSLVPTKALVWTVATYEGAERYLILSDDPAASLSTIPKAEFPTRTYFADFALGTSSERRMGDVVLPNVLFQLDEALFDTEISKENRDDFVRDAVFLECYEEHRDYDFGPFGLSVGGLSVGRAKNSAIRDDDFETLEKIGIAYGSDTLDTDSRNFVRAGVATETDARPVLCISGGLVENPGERSSEAELADRIASILVFLEGTYGNDVAEESSEIPEISVIAQ